MIQTSNDIRKLSICLMSMMAICSSAILLGALWVPMVPISIGLQGLGAAMVLGAVAGSFYLFQIDRLEEGAPAPVPVTRQRS